MESTLDRLQSLKDAEFHALCDELLPRISCRYHPLVPHGRNATRDSIRGQPDSYVGNSAKTCRIAVQYTVQRNSWWSKAVDDVKEAREACGDVEEIVLVLPRDIDREKPTKGQFVNWQGDAEIAAAPAALTIFHGRTLAEQLDTNCQDLRRDYLGIPFSRITWHALIAGCRESSEATISRLKLLGRYDPDHYIDRDADERLFALWQQALRNAKQNTSGEEYQTLVPLIADSGIGKTSLLARFVGRTSCSAPVLLLPARDMSLPGSGSLIRDVMERLQGALDAGLRSSEESHRAAILQGKTPLTIVLDGLDETKNDVGIRESIDGWVRSRLGRRSILILSSRPEFWRKCRDATWASLIVNEDNRSKSTKLLRHQRDLSSLDPLQGIQLPGKFSSRDVVRAWVQSGRAEPDYWQLSLEVRKELQHPFTLKSAIELLRRNTPPSELKSRPGIMSLWIRNRLKLEADANARITESLYRDSLLIVAREAELSGGSWVPVDRLTAVPRFDKSQPPGEVVERLIAANLLETHPEQHDQIRFSFDAVYDFFLAESKLSDIDKDPKGAARSFAELTFSRAATLLERIGDQVATHGSREQFVNALAELDGPKAAVVLRPFPASYSAACRALVVSSLKELLSSRMTTERALATELLGRLICPESAAALEDHWKSDVPSDRLHAVVSSAVIAQSISELVSVVFETFWFKHDDFFIDLKPELSAASNEFQSALAEYASQYLIVQADSENYRRALRVLAYLSDERAVCAIEERTRNAEPYFYESACLQAIGSPRALCVYSTLVDRYLQAQKSDTDKESRDNHWRGVVAYGSSIGNLASKELEEFATTQIQSDNSQRRIIGRKLAEKVGNKRMLALLVKHWKVEGYVLPGPQGFGRRLGVEKWLELWNEDATIGRRKVLIRIASELRDYRVENTLIESLDNADLAGHCAQSLAAIGSERACDYLRRSLLNDGRGQIAEWNRSMALHSLARLRDPASVHDITRYLESEEGRNEYEGTICLASIASAEVEQALLNLKYQSDELYVRGLVCSGSRNCVEQAVEIARRHDNSAAWLLHNCRFCFRFNGWSRYDFRTDVYIQPLLDFVLAEELSLEMYDDLKSLMDVIDVPVVRDLFRSWYGLRGTSNDIAMKSNDTRLSDIGFRELAERGDDYVLEEFVKREIHHWKDRFFHDIVVRGFRVFDIVKIVAALQNLIETEADEKARVAALNTVGYVGSVADLLFLDAYVSDKSDLISNAAFEAKLRISDPLRLAERW